MKQDDYKRVVSNYKPSPNLEYRLSQRITKTAHMNRPRVGTKYIAAAAAICVLTLFVTFGLPLITTPAENQFSGFAFIAYAADSDQSTLTSDYETTSIPTVLVPGVTVNLPTYSPLMSSVPGFPFSVGSQEATDKEFTADYFVISADKGDLLTWDTDTWQVGVIASSDPVNNNVTVYWSPLSRDTSSEPAQGKITITVKAFKDDKQVSEQYIVIQEVDGQYSARVE